MTVHEDKTTGEATAELTEVEQLRAEVARLHAERGSWQPSQPETPPPTTERRHGGWRWLGAGVLLVLVAMLAPLAVVATWVHDEISNTDRYVQTVTPLASNKAVQDAAIARVTNEIYTRLDVKAVTNDAVNALAAQGLPPRVAAGLSALSTPLANGVHSFIENAVTKVIRSPQFQEAWVAANREAHAQLVAVLTGNGSDTVQVTGNTVSINLAALIDGVKQKLVQSGFTLANRIPEVNATFPIMKSADLAKAQNGFRILSAAARTLPILALLLLAGAVFLAPARRKALVIGALVVAASMLLLGAVLNGFRIVYLDAFPPGQLQQNAAAAIYDQLVGFIRLNLRAILVLFLAIATVAWVTGPWAPAVATRRTTNRAVDSVRHGSDRAGLRTGAFGTALYNMRTPIRFGLGALVVLIYVLAAHPTGAFTIVLLLVAAVILLAIELLARPPAATAPLATSGTSSGGDSPAG